jgi:tyrosyl-tRNA synthetase
MIAANMRDYKAQASKILDFERAEVAYNSSWLAPLSMSDLIRLMAETTVAQMLSRNDFALRYATGTPIALHEFLYPIVQAYDSVAMRADVELGGSDQLFNFLLAREYQAHAGQPRQICMTSPILEGTDGVVRMGKSKGNYIALTEPASEQFGKVMSLPDHMIVRYAQLAAFEPPAKVAALDAALASGKLHPMAAKKDLAESIVSRYHGAAEARSARERFEATVQRGELPAEMREIAADPAWRYIADAMVAAGFAVSKRDAERLVAGNGVKLDGNVVSDPRTPWKTGDTAIVLSVGNRRFVRIVPANRQPSNP